MGSIDAFRTYVDRFGIWAYLIYWIVQFMAVVFVPIPGNVITVAGGALFGFWMSTVLSLTANFAASFLMFGLVRLMGQSFVRSFMGKHKTSRYFELFTRKRDSFLFLTILLPFFPDDLICMLAGLTEIPFRKFALILFAAKPWGLIISTVVGVVGINLPLPWMIALGALGAALFVCGLLFGERIERFLRKRITAFGRKS